MADAIRVCLETGRTWTFAAALDWPGWSRRGKGEEAALEALAEYSDRYAHVVGHRFRPGRIRVVGRVPGNATTDFGAPAVIGKWDRETVEPREANRLIELLRDCWDYFDSVVASAPPELRKGPRGGGRDRDAIADHVREAEHSYAPKSGVRVPPRTPWPEQRKAIAEGLANPTDSSWPLRYAVRRIAWHVLDHAWEIEDRVERPG